VYRIKKKHHVKPLAFLLRSESKKIKLIFKKEIEMCIIAAPSSKYGTKYKYGTKNLKNSKMIWSQIIKDTILLYLRIPKNHNI